MGTYSHYQLDSYVTFLSTLSKRTGNVFVIRKQDKLYSIISDVAKSFSDAIIVLRDYKKIIINIFY